MSDARELNSKDMASSRHKHLVRNYGAKKQRGGQLIRMNATNQTFLAAKILKDEKYS